MELDRDIDPPHPNANRTTSKKPAIFTVVLIVSNVSSSLRPGLSQSAGRQTLERTISRPEAAHANSATHEQ